MFVKSVAVGVVVAGMFGMNLWIEPALAHESAAEAPADVAFQKQIEDALNQRDMAAVFMPFDAGVFTERLNRFLPADGKIGDDVGSSILRDVQGGLASNVSTIGKAKFLRSRAMDGDTRLLYRLTDDGGVTYFAFTVVPSDKGMKITDLYMTSLGEQLSELFGRMLLRAKQAEANNDQTFLQDTDLYTKMADANKKGDAQEVLRLFDQLGNLKRERSANVIRLQAASSLEDPVLLDKICTEFIAQYPNDIAGDLFMIDAFFTMKQYDKAMAAIERVDQSVGGDPYLMFIRSGIHKLAGDDANAQKCLLVCIEQEPSLEEAANALLDRAINDKNFADTRKWLLHLEKNCGYQFEPNLNDVEAFSEFKKSPEYQEWLKEKKP